MGTSLGEPALPLFVPCIPLQLFDPGREGYRLPNQAFDGDPFDCLLLVIDHKLLCHGVNLERDILPGQRLLNIIAGIPKRH